MTESGVELIRRERERQTKEEGHSEADDDSLPKGALAKAGAAYAIVDSDGYKAGLDLWPFNTDWFRPKDRLRNLVRAGALIAAEIDRLQRAG